MTALSHVPQAPADKAPTPVFTAALVGEVDMDRTGELHQLVVAFEASGASSAEIDMSAVTFMDSTALGTLSRLRNVAVARDGNVALVCPTPAVTKVLDIVGFAAIFEIRPPR